MKLEIKDQVVQPKHPHIFKQFWGIKRCLSNVSLVVSKMVYNYDLYTKNDCTRDEIQNELLIILEQTKRKLFQSSEFADLSQYPKNLLALDSLYNSLVVQKVPYLPMN